MHHMGILQDLLSCVASWPLNEGARATALSPAPADTHVIAAAVVELIVAVAATIPFIRRPTARTALFTLAFWLSSAVTVAGQPLYDGDGRVAGALHGSVGALLVYDGLVVAWATCGSLLYIVHMHPLDDTARLRLICRRLLLLHGAVLLILLALLPFAIADPWVRREGVWFPVASGMAPAPFIYDLVGKTYVGAMFVWAAIGCWQASRIMTRPTVRFGALCACCLVCGIIALSIAVTIAQLRHQEFFATHSGQLTSNLWLLLGLLLPLAALFTAGIVRRWRLFWLARDLRALVRSLIVTLSHAAPERRQAVVAWSELVTAGRLSLDRASGGPSGPRGVTGRRRQAIVTTGVEFVKAVAENALPILRDPVADVDRLAILARDLLEAAYPMPGQAALLAAAWLRKQPTEVTTSLHERDVAMLLLAATIIGGEHGLFERIPLDYPTPLTHLFEADRSWEYPASARFLQATWRALRSRRDRSVHDVVRQGLNELQRLLDTTTYSERDGIVLASLGLMEQDAPWWWWPSSCDTSTALPPPHREL